MAANLVLLNSMLTIAVLVFNIFHPGYCFKRPAAQDTATYEKQTVRKVDSSLSDAVLLSHNRSFPPSETV